MGTLLAILIGLFVALGIDILWTIRKLNKELTKSFTGTSNESEKQYIEVLDSNDRLCYIDKNAIDAVIENFSKKTSESQGVTIIAQGVHIDSPSTNYHTLTNQL